MIREFFIVNQSKFRILFKEIILAGHKLFNGFPASVYYDMLVSDSIIYGVEISCVAVQNHILTLLQERDLASKIIFHGCMLCRTDVVVVDVCKYADLVLFTIYTVHLHSL